MRNTQVCSMPPYLVTVIFMENNMLNRLQLAVCFHMHCAQEMMGTHANDIVRNDAVAPVNQYTVNVRNVQGCSIPHFSFNTSRGCFSFLQPLLRSIYVATLTSYEYTYVRLYPS